MPNGAIDGSNGNESQSSAAISFSDGMKLISDMLRDIGVLFTIVVLPLAVPLSGREGGHVEDVVVVPRLFLPFEDTNRLRRRREMCKSSSVA